MSSSTDEMRNAVQALLNDMRHDVGGLESSPHRGASSSPRHFGVGQGGSSGMTGARLADIDVLRSEINRLESDLHRAQVALGEEKAQHAKTKELLRLALRPSAADVALDGSPARGRHRRAGSGSPQHRGGSPTVGGGLSPAAISPGAVPGFVKQAAYNNHQHLASRAYPSSSNAVMELFERVTSTPRARGASPAPSKSNQSHRHHGGASEAYQRWSRSNSVSSSAVHHGRGGGGRSSPSTSTNKATGGAFGSRAERFQAVSLTGHHGTFAGSRASARDELSRDEAKALAKEMRRSGMLTPPRTRVGGAGVAKDASPLFTGVVKASPASTATLRSPDIAQWVRQLQRADA